VINKKKAFFRAVFATSFFSLVIETSQLIMKVGVFDVDDLLMNTVGVENRDLSEKPPFSQRIITSILKRVLPPFKDSYLAAEFLRRDIGKSNPKIEWVIVRPDSLIDENEVTDYNLYTSPIRNVIFNPGKTSRINVADFMKLLLIDKDLWDNFKFQMPVIYNK
jgi:hypothetical protein